MFQDTYGNEAALASFINDNCVLKTEPNTFTGTQTFPSKSIHSAGINLGVLANTENPVIGDLYYDPDVPGFIGIVKIGDIATATNASPIVVTTTAEHNLNPGDSVFISGALGNTAANGFWNITIINSTSFSLNGSTGTGAYTSGGVVCGYDQFVTISDIGAFPTRHHASAPPVWASASTLTVAYIEERDSLDQFNIAKPTTTTVNTATSGLNGMATSALTGTVSVTSGSASVTFSDAQAGLQVGDVIVTAGGQAKRLISGAGTSWTAASNFASTETTVACSRGGMAASTFYYLYCITNGVTSGLIVSTRNVAGGDTLVDLPSGYNWSSQLAFSFLTDGSAGIMPFRIAAGWPKRPRIDYVVKIANSNTDVRVLSAGTLTTYTALACASFIPPVSRMGIFAWDSSTTGAVFIRESGNTAHEIAVQNGSGSTLGHTDVTCPVSSSQQIDYKVSNNNVSIYVQGFVVTEVP